MLNRGVLPIFLGGYFLLPSFPSSVGKIIAAVTAPVNKIPFAIVFAILNGIVIGANNNEVTKPALLLYLFLAINCLHITIVI